MLPLWNTLPSEIDYLDQHPFIYLKNRISVPRDMPLLSGRFFRQAIESTASVDGTNLGPKISTRNN